jgi:hypothetical protein
MAGDLLFAASFLMHLLLTLAIYSISMQAQQARLNPRGRDCVLSKKINRENYICRKSYS